MYVTTSALSLARRNQRYASASRNVDQGERVP